MAKNMYVGVGETYTPVEYLESTGTQYIDTGIDALDIFQNFKLVEEAQYSTSSTRQQFGAVNYDRKNPSEIHYLVPISIFENNFFVQMEIGNGTIVTSADTNLHTFITDNVNGKASVDSTEVSFAVSTTSTTHRNIFLFARNLNGIADLFCNKKVYSTKIYNGDTLIRDYIPVLDDNNIPCLFDKVENKFYYNNGTGNFTAGSVTGEPVSIGKARKIVKAYVGVHNISRQIIKGYVGVASSYTPVEYIESTGTQYIDSGVTSWQVNRIVAEFYNTFGLLYNSKTYGGSCVGARVSASDSYFGYNSGIEAEMLGNGTSYTGFQRGISTEKITLDYSKSSYSVVWGSDTHSENLSASIATPLNMYVFAVNNNGTASCGTYKISKMQFYDSNNELIRDFIPVLDENNMACLYDKIENKPYYNKGTGTFISGSPTGEPAVTISVARQFYI